jgi:hypothetical protein
LLPLFPYPPRIFRKNQAVEGNGFIVKEASRGLSRDVKIEISPLPCGASRHGKRAEGESHPAFDSAPKGFFFHGGGTCSKKFLEKAAERAWFFWGFSGKNIPENHAFTLFTIRKSGDLRKLPRYTTDTAEQDDSSVFSP